MVLKISPFHRTMVAMDAQSLPRHLQIIGLVLCFVLCFAFFEFHFSVNGNHFRGAVVGPVPNGMVAEEKKPCVRLRNTLFTCSAVRF